MKIFVGVALSFVIAIALLSSCATPEILKGDPKAYPCPGGPQEHSCSDGDGCCPNTDVCGQTPEGMSCHAGCCFVAGGNDENIGAKTPHKPTDRRR